MSLPLLTFLFTLLGFISGSLMFSLWLGRLALNRDIRTIGDGNPGTTNVFKAGGKAVGIAALLLDMTKGALPVGIAAWLVGITGWWLVPIALAPVLGHAFSPFVGGKGGKAVAVSGGIWIGLTLWEVPLVGGVLLIAGFSLIGVSGWALMYTCVGVLIYFVLVHPDPVLITIFILNTLLLAYKYRTDLRRFPIPRSWLAKRLGFVSPQPTL